MAQNSLQIVSEGECPNSNLPSIAEPDVSLSVDPTQFMCDNKECDDRQEIGPICDNEGNTHRYAFNSTWHILCQVPSNILSELLTVTSARSKRRAVTLHRREMRSRLRTTVSE